MSEYLLMEQEADSLAQKQKEMLDTVKAEKREFTSAERDEFFNMQGAASALETHARKLRDAELETLKRTPTVESEQPKDAVVDFNSFIRKGTEPRASVTTTDANGGYIVK